MAEASTIGRRHPVGAIASVLLTTLALLIVAVAMRFAMWISTATTLGAALHVVRDLPGFSVDDLQTIALITAPVALLALLCARFSRLSWVIARGWYGVGLLLAVLAGVNVTAVYWLRSPITYQWFYYADIFNSAMARSTLTGAVDLSSVLLILASLIGFVVLRQVLAVVFAAISQRASPAFAVVALAVVVALPALYCSVRYHGHVADPYGRTANPLHMLATSTMAAMQSPFSVADKDADDRDYRVGLPAPPLPAPKPTGNNIVLIVLESVGARDVLAPDAQLPTLTALRAHGLTFAQTYVSVAASPRSAFALTTSRFPLFGYRPETRDLADRRFVSIANRLKQAGYATALLMGAESRYEDQDRFLDGKGFDTRIDMHKIACRQRNDQSNARWQFIDSVSDECLTDAFLHWHDGERHRPFFAMIWTNNTHFPYYGADTVADPRARHAEALRNADQQIGRIVTALNQSGELAHTTFIVVGDHGEAFNDHGNARHSTTVYEEEVRVAPIVAGAGVPVAGVDNRIATLPDIAPTILDLAGLPPEPTWQGRSLLRALSRQRVYFFATSKDYTLGYREGETKVMLDLTSGTNVKFDLARDPGEHHPLALTPDEARAARRHIAGWVAYNRALYDRR